MAQVKDVQRRAIVLQLHHRFPDAGPIAKPLSEGLSSFSGSVGLVRYCGFLSAFSSVALLSV